MANNYLEFSEVIPCLTAEEEAWLRSQLQCVYVFGSQEFTEDELPSGLHGEDADWYGCRAWRDLQGYDPDDGELFGFAYEFHDDHDTPDAWGRHLWLHAEEWANVEQLVHLVQKFLRQFRPQDCWSLTYATTCSKPRVGEFGGGAVFVTADEVKWENAYEFVEVQGIAFGKKTAPDSTRPENAVQSYDLIMGGPELRTQRGLLLRLTGSLHRGERPQLDPGDVEPLEGLINLTDAIADQAADRYGIDCLLPVSEEPDTSDMEENRQETERLTRQAEENGVQPERLDELVHEIASSHAASINNGGLSEQIEYLVKELGAAEVERILSGPDR